MKIKKRDGEEDKTPTDHAKMNPEETLTALIRDAAIRAISIVKKPK